MVNHIIYNLKAPIYETTLLIIKREHQKKKSTTNATNLEDLKDEIRQTFTSYKTTSKNKQSISAEVSIVAAAKPPSTPKKTGTKFKGDCRLCGVKGH